MGVDEAGFTIPKTRNYARMKHGRMQESSLIGRDVYSLKKIGSFGSGIMT